MAEITLVPLLLAIFATVGPTSVISVDIMVVPETVVYTNLGDDAEIFCLVPPKIPPTEQKLCRYIRYGPGPNGERTIILNATNDMITGQVGLGTFSYFGNGVDKGECGLRIKDVSEDQLGRWGCSFIGGGEVSTGSLTLIEYEKPEPPQIFHQNSIHHPIEFTDYENETVGKMSPIQINCCTIGGTPIEETRLSFFLGEVEIPDSILVKNATSPPRTTCIRYNATFVAEDNDKFVYCSVSHPSLTNCLSDELEIYKDSIYVNVSYRPHIIYHNEDSTKDFIMKRIYQDGNVDLYFNAKGNPTPSVQVRISPTTDKYGKYKLSDIEIKNVKVNTENNAHEFVLTIAAPTEEEGNTAFEITLSNTLGKDVSVTIVSPQPGDEGYTFWILIAVGVVMSLVFIGILAYFLNSSAKKRGWCCYKRRTESYPVKKRERGVAGTEISVTRNQEYSSVATAIEDSSFN